MTLPPSSRFDAHPALPPLRVAESLAGLPTWTVALAALFAPLCVWILWRLQVLSVELLRARLIRLLRDGKWIYNTVSWFGTFLHEMSHATVLLLSGHGIKQFSVKADHGHVLPRRMRRGPLGFLFFLVAALAPLFGPPALVLVALTLLVDPELMPWHAAGPGLAAAVGVLETVLLEFPRALLSAVAHLDLRDPWHAAALAAIVVGIPGSRPSHAKGSRFHGTKDEGDVAVVRQKIRENPWPLLVFVALLLAAYWPATEHLPKAYWYPFEAVWAVAITAILLAAGGAIWWTIVTVGMATKRWLAWIPLAALVALQVYGHQAGWELVIVNGSSFAAYAALAGLLGLAFPRRKRLPI